MNKVSGLQVKSLRIRSGAGVLDCKKALEISNGDEELAIKWLREKGISAHEKRSCKETSEGVVAGKTDDSSSMGVLVSIRCETDFVARNEKMWGMARSLCDVLLSNQAISDSEQLEQADINNSKVSDVLIDLSATIKENIKLGEIAIFRAKDKSNVYSYIHGNLINIDDKSTAEDKRAAKETGTLGVIVRIASKGASQDTLNEFGNNLAMHIAAMNPDVISQEDLTEEIINNESDIAMKKINENPNTANKTEEQKNQIASGMVKKAVADRVLYLQQYAINDKLTVKQAADEAQVTILEFAKVIIGA
ncbi:MAG: translation elongation factor Ts [Alphaproteobacteria bacterium]|nr:MAG: translation elongation factor Ts [Alphaproteobacteria bacterium]